jgi:hypothetical protein
VASAARTGLPESFATAPKNPKTTLTASAHSDTPTVSTAPCKITHRYDCVVVSMVNCVRGVA